MNIEILNYIKKYKDKYPKDILRKDLANKGYALEEIEEAFSQLELFETQQPKPKTWLWVLIIVILLLLLFGLIAYLFYIRDGKPILKEEEEIKTEEMTETDGLKIFQGLAEGELLILKLDDMDMYDESVFPKSLWINYEIEGDTAVNQRYETMSSVFQGGRQIVECQSSDLRLSNAIGSGRTNVDFCNAANCDLGIVRNMRCTGDIGSLSPGNYTIKVNIFTRTTKEYLGTLEKDFTVH